MGVRPAGTLRMERGAEVHSSWDRDLDSSWEMQGRVREACSVQAVARQMSGGWKLEPLPHCPHPRSDTTSPICSTQEMSCYPLIIG